MRMLKRLVAAGLLVGSVTLASASEFKIGDLVLQDLWSRATPKGATTAVGYLKIENHGTTADRLIGGTSPIADKGIQPHEMTMDGTVMRMHLVAGGLTIEPGQTLTIEPNHYHLMFVELKAPLQKGDKVRAALQFERAGKVDVEFNVQAIGATTPGTSHQVHPRHY